MYNPQRVIIQGITGRHGSFHAARMQAYGTPLVAGTSPGHAGERVVGLPVYNTVEQLVAHEGPVDASVVFVPAPAARAAISEAITVGIPLVVCITEGIPLHDMLDLRRQITQTDGRTRLVGPNCPGILVPGRSLLGIIPTDLARPGSVAILSRSGTLTYEATALLSQAGIGQAIIIGVGGDPITGMSFVDHLQQLVDDPTINQFVLIGEIGGTAEYQAADYLAGHTDRPVVAYIAGQQAPADVQMGHAGAILGSADESAAAKTAYLRTRGLTTIDSITRLPAALSGQA